MASLTVAVLVLSLCAAPSLAQPPRQCPSNAGPVRNVDGVLVFDSLASNQDYDIPDYDPGPLKGWYAMANGFNDVVRPGSLPYDIITDAIETLGLRCNIIKLPNGSLPANCTSTESGRFDPLATLQQFTSWWAGIIVVLCLGLVFALAFLVCGCCFCCCRCCGNCGGSSTKKPRGKNTDICMGILTSVLVLITLVLLIGGVFAFLTNEQSYKSLEATQTTINAVVDTGIDYATNTLSEGDALVVYFDTTAQFILCEADFFFGNLTRLADTFSTDVNGVLDTLTNITGNLSSTGIATLTTLLTDIQNTSSLLLAGGMALDSSLMSVATSAASLKTNCVTNTSGNSTCNMIPTTFASGVDFTQLPNISAEIDNIQSSTIGAVNLTSDIETGRQMFNTTTTDILNTVETQFSSIGDFVGNQTMSLTDVWNSSVRGMVEEVLNNTYDAMCDPFPSFSITGSATIGQIRECLINNVFDALQQYDVYRYAFGIVVASLSLVVVLLVLIGVVLGLVGFRRGREPTERTGLSHCGGVVLIVAVILAFIFGFFLMVLAAVGFFFGANASKACQAIAPSRYELFEQLIDNEDLWGGSLLGSIVFRDALQTFSLSQALRNCENNQALYSALNLSRIQNVSELLLDANEAVSTLRTDFDDTVNDLLGNYNPDDFLNNDTRDSLRNFTDVNLDQINISAFREQIEAPLLTFNLTDTITTLESLETTFISIPSPSLAFDTRSIITSLENIRDTELPAIMGNLNTLEMQVDQLNTQLESFIANASQAVDVILQLTSNLTQEGLMNLLQPLSVHIDNSLAFVDDFISATNRQLDNELGRCQPLAEIYNSMYEVICLNALDGLNGFWWSLGWCAILFLPTIILAVIVSTFYCRAKQLRSEGGYKDSDYDMKHY